MARFSSSYVRGSVVLWRTMKCDACGAECACTEGVLPLPLTTAQMREIVPLPPGGFHRMDPDDGAVYCSACK